MAADREPTRPQQWRPEAPRKEKPMTTADESAVLHALISLVDPNLLAPGGLVGSMIRPNAGREIATAIGNKVAPETTADWKRYVETTADEHPFASAAGELGAAALPVSAPARAPRAIATKAPGVIHDAATVVRARPPAPSSGGALDDLFVDPSIPPHQLRRQPPPSTSYSPQEIDAIMREVNAQGAQNLRRANSAPGIDLSRRNLPEPSGKLPLQELLEDQAVKKQPGYTAKEQHDIFREVNAQGAQNLGRSSAVEQTMLAAREQRKSEMLKRLQAAIAREDELGRADTLVTRPPKGFTTLDEALQEGLSTNEARGRRRK